MPASGRRLASGSLIFRRAMLGVMKKIRIPPLAVGIGIYLPMSATFAVIVGAVIAHWYDRRSASMPNPDRARSDWTPGGVGGVGIVGESISGVIKAPGSLCRGSPKRTRHVIAFAPAAFAPAPWLGGNRVRGRDCGLGD